MQHLGTMAGLGLLLAASPGFADEFTCLGPFARDTDHKRLMAAFGPDHVRLETVQEPEGMKSKASIVFPEDPAKRLEVVWRDGKSLRHPIRIDLVGSDWSAPKGLRVGASIEEVEKANGKPFVLYGFEWDYGGTVAGWNGGALGHLPGGCALYPVFEAEDTASDDVLDAVSGDARFPSDSPLMKAAQPRIRSLALRFPH
ncbi:hypothetical protein GGR34_003913 [Microvirga flocculans]|uniref:Uncharacterized protein n=1 Tax=Microvirga flocculans TaxID=217168 RepID=A0A7W6IJZ2_9HYPH|nr:hypothetical protein [Microvirga flocculans]MBB4042224.1 hypothetical protein [Microvirga flocculans]